jgi:hypothetical protein
MVGTQARLLDADVILNGTDTHSSRAALAELSIRGVIPLIDTGVRVGTRRRRLDSLWFERRIQVPEGPCLWCWDRLSAEQIGWELARPEERGRLLEEGYITGVPGEPAPSVASLTVTAAGAATAALLGMLSGAFDAAPLAVGTDAISLEATEIQPREPNPDCICARWRWPIASTQRPEE